MATSSPLSSKVDTKAKGRSAGVQWKTVALPTEHGGWGFATEPTLLGLIVAPSWAGVCLGIAGLMLFLLDHPLRLLFKDLLRRKYYPRTKQALIVTSIYTTILIITALAAFALAPQPFWLALLAALPFAGLHFLGTFTRERRALWVELLGAWTFGWLAPAVVFASQGPSLNGAILWIVPALRALVSIIYVRRLLRQQRGEPITRWSVVALHVISLLVIAVLVQQQWLALGAILAFAVLLARATYGLYWRKQSLTPARIGAIEMLVGYLTAILAS